jgi:hypothetical protein
MDGNGRMLLFRTRSLPTSLTDMAGIALDAVSRRWFTSASRMRHSHYDREALPFDD